MKYGFIKVAAAVPAVKVADVEYNVKEIERLVALADGEGAEVVCFPELCLTGYSCQDLFKEQLLLSKAEEGIIELCPRLICLIIMSSMRSDGLPLLRT